MRITRISVQRPVTVCMVFLAFVFLGWISLNEMRLDLLPDIQYPRLSVLTRYAGVSPDELETLVAIPLESSLRKIPGLRRLETVLKEGLVITVLEFSWGEDMDLAFLHAMEKTDSVQVDGADVETLIVSLDPQARPIMMLSLRADNTLLELKQFAENLIKPRLEQLEGIASAEIVGGDEREIKILVDPGRLSLYGIELEKIAVRLDNQNRNFQGGMIRRGYSEYAVKVVGEFENLDEIGETIIKTTEEKGIIRLKDIAVIKSGTKEKEGMTKLNGRECIGILIRKEYGANTIIASKGIQKTLTAIRSEYPSMELLVVTEQAGYIRNAIQSVVRSIVFGGILAFMVLFVFLKNIRIPFIISLAIPVSILTTFNLLVIRNITLNLMSLGGLALGTGMLVDNSIVVSECIHRHHAMGKDIETAALTGSKEVGMAVTAATFTTISVFLPVIYVHGVAGQLFRAQSLAVTFSLLSSLVISLTLVPMLLSRKFVYPKDLLKKESDRILQPRKLTEKKRRILFLPAWMLLWMITVLMRIIGDAVNQILKCMIRLGFLIIHKAVNLIQPVTLVLFRLSDRLYEKCSALYHRGLVWSLDHKEWILIGSFIVFGSTVFLSTQIPKELMPKPETPLFELDLKTHVECSFDQTEDVVSRVENWLAEQTGVKNVFSQIGLVSGFEIFDTDVSRNSAKIHVSVIDPKTAGRIVEVLQKRLEKMSEVSRYFVHKQLTLSEFLGFSVSEVSIKIKGESIPQLDMYAKSLSERLQNIPEINGTHTSIHQGKPEYHIFIDQESLVKYDFSSDKVGSFIVDAVRGKIVTQFKKRDKNIDVLLRFKGENRMTIDALLEKEFISDDIRVPLHELVTCRIEDGAQEIRRENQQRVVLVTAGFQKGKMNHVIPKIRKEIDEITLLPGYRIDFSGEKEEMFRSFQSLLAAFLIAVILVYMIMAAQFESFVHPLLILLTLPLGLIGVVWALFISGQTINVISVIGMVVLVGIVVNDAILKVDCMNRLRKQGGKLRDSILESSRIRLRPILITSITTAFGLLPMSLGIGNGSELQQPLAISIIGGLSISTLLTLILIPVVYELAENNR